MILFFIRSFTTLDYTDMNVGRGMYVYSNQEYYTPMEVQKAVSYQNNGTLSCRKRKEQESHKDTEKRKT